MKTAVFYLFLGMCVVAPSVAQEPGTGDKPHEAKGRLAWFVYLELPKDVESTLRLLTGGKLSDLALSESSPSMPVPIPADGIIQIVKEGPDPKNDGSSKYATLGKIVIPDSMRHVLVLLSPSVKNAGDEMIFRNKLINLDSFKGGGQLFINTTGSKVGVEIGSSKLLVNPGDMKIETVGREATPGTVPFRYSYFDAGKNKWTQFSASVDITTSLQREIRIFYINQLTGKIRCRGIVFPVEM